MCIKNIYLAKSQKHCEAMTNGDRVLSCTCKLNWTKENLPGKVRWIRINIHGAANYMADSVFTAWGDVTECFLACCGYSSGIYSCYWKDTREGLPSSPSLSLPCRAPRLNNATVFLTGKSLHAVPRLESYCSDYRCMFVDWGLHNLTPVFTDYVNFSFKG